LTRHSPRPRRRPDVTEPSGVGGSHPPGPIAGSGAHAARHRVTPQGGYPPLTKAGGPRHFPVVEVAAWLRCPAVAGRPHCREAVRGQADHGCPTGRRVYPLEPSQPLYLRSACGERCQLRRRMARLNGLDEIEAGVLSLAGTVCLPNDSPTSTVATHAHTPVCAGRRCGLLNRTRPHPYRGCLNRLSYTPKQPRVDRSSSQTATQTADFP
jgi:hypothetical protein